MLSKIYIQTKNPYNIRYNGSNNWLGSLPHDYKGFAVFIDEVFGIRAGFVLLLRYIKVYGFRSVREVVSRFAPSSENDTESYINFVSDELINAGYNPENINTLDLSFFYLCRAMAKFETGFKLDLLTYNYICQRFNLEV